MYQSVRATLWMCTFYFLCLILAPTIHSSGVPIVGSLTLDDRQKLKTFFEQSINDLPLEPSKLHYAIKGLLALDEKITLPKDLCNVFSRSLNSSELAYFHAFAIKKLTIPNCKILHKEIETQASSILSGSTQLEDLFWIVMALKEIGSKIDQSLVLKHVNRIKLKDSSPSTIGILFQIVSILNLSKAEWAQYTTLVNDVLGQADELEGKFVYFEKGLYTTALVAQGISDLILTTGEAKVVQENQLVKLINFIYKRLHSTNLRATAHLLTALKSLAKNPYLAPVVLTSTTGPASMIHHEQPNIRLRVAALWDDRETYTSDLVTLRAAGLYEIHGPNALRVLTGPTERGSLAMVDKNVYQLSLATSSFLPNKGRYELELSGTWTKQNSAKRLLGISGVMVPVHVSVDASVVNPTMSLVDNTNDRHVVEAKLSPGQLYKASTPNGTVSVDLGFHLSLAFRLVDSKQSSVPLTVHQVFLQLTHYETQQEITFTPNQANTDGYKFRLDPGQSAAEFDYLEGIYKAELFVGDFFLRKPMLWHMVDLHLHFEGVPGADSAQRHAQALDVSRQRTASVAALKRASRVNSFIGTGPTHRQQEIEHTFRAPEKRAPRLLALVFTVACVLPLIGLLIVWATLGINVWNFRFRLSNILFHTGLIAIFALYLTYWYCLDMFTTLRYLVGLSVLTFWSGTRALRAHLSDRMATCSPK